MAFVKDLVGAHQAALDIQREPYYIKSLMMPHGEHVAKEDIRMKITISTLDSRPSAVT